MRLVGIDGVPSDLPAGCINGSQDERWSKSKRELNSPSKAAIEVEGALSASPKKGSTLLFGPYLLFEPEVLHNNTRTHFCTLRVFKVAVLSPFRVSRISPSVCRSSTSENTINLLYTEHGNGVIFTRTGKRTKKRTSVCFVAPSSQETAKTSRVDGKVPAVLPPAKRIQKNHPRTLKTECSTETTMLGACVASTPLHHSGQQTRQHTHKHTNTPTHK